jgi:hypothetical protein
MPKHQQNLGAAYSGKTTIFTAENAVFSHLPHTLKI